MMDLYRDLQIAVEVCPISNHRLGYVYDLRLHPALYYLRTGIPVVICSDDGLFMTPRPLVDDFYSAVLCWDLSIESIREICERSIRAGGLSEEETDHLLQVWRRSWNAFCGEQLKAIKGAI